MEDQVIDLVVAVDETGAISGLSRGVAEEGHHVVLVRDLAHGNRGLNVDGGGLRLRDGIEGVDLAVVEACGFAVRAKVDGGGGDAVKFGERGYGGVPPRGC